MEPCLLPNLTSVDAARCFLPPCSTIAQFLLASPAVPAARLSLWWHCTIHRLPKTHPNHLPKLGSIGISQRSVLWAPLTSYFLNISTEFHGTLRIWVQSILPPVALLAALHDEPAPEWGLGLGKSVALPTSNLQKWFQHGSMCFARAMLTEFTGAVPLCPEALVNCKVPSSMRTVRIVK